MADLIEIAAGDYRLLAEPARGGSIAAFRWRGQPLFRATCGPSILDTACFPLVPFSNRITDGRFVADGREVRIAPNFPGGDHPHPLHGFAWLAPWEVVEHHFDALRLRHRYPGGEWPWAYEAEQHLRLSPDGLLHGLSVRNLADTPMPAGLGLHPYFPRTDNTRYHGLHRGEWRTSANGLPQALIEADRPIDWWAGRPVGERIVDTVYTDRNGPLEIAWPERGIRLEIAPDASLSLTVVYVPPDADHFCVEPVSHPTDAINRAASTAMRRIEPGDTFECSVSYRGHRYATERFSD